MTRTVAFEGCMNFRDLGGYATADGGHVGWRRLYRSDSLHRMSAADVDRLVADLGIVSFIDLRTAGERQRGGPVLAEARPEVTARHVAMVDEILMRERPAVEAPSPPENMGVGYVAMLDIAGDRVAEVLRLLAEPGALPAVFACAAGKDRTGVLSAVVLSLLRVADEDVVADYALTGEVAPALVARERAAVPEYVEVWDRLPDEARRAPAHVMRSMLACVAERHGSMQGYARSIGVGDDEVERLRDALVP